VSWSPGERVTLRTQRLELRSLTEADATERYLAWLHDAEVMRYVNARFATHDLDRVRAYIRAHDDRRRFLLGIFVRAAGAHVGNYEAQVDGHHRRAHIGVLIGDRAWWGRGVVIEAREVLLDFLFDVLDVVKVCGQCYASNRAALFNYQAQGFATEGILRSHVVLGNGRDDVVQFAMTREAWQARRSALA
jgi:RimJ/RimL family protein N-acetyltransferase